MKIRPSISEQKAATRKLLLERRARLDPHLRAVYSSAVLENLIRLPQIPAAGVAFCFISTGAEVSTRALIDRLVAMDKMVLAPKILRGEPMRAVPFRGWEHVTPGVLGIPAPVDDTAHLGRVDLVITPGVGFTPAGIRLGYGRGYYDQWFASHEHGLRVGIAFECQLEDTLPAEASDVPVHILITEQRTIVMRPNP